MKRTISTIAATAVAATIAVGVAAPAQAYTNKDRAYVRTVRADSAELRLVPARLLIKLARSSCAAMREGMDPVDLVYLAIDSGMTADSGIAVTAGAAAFYCPDVSYLFEDGASA